MTTYAAPGQPGSLVTYESRLGNWIGGAWTDPVGGEWFENPSPVNGQTFISDLLSGKYPASYFSLDNFRSWDTTQLALAPGALWNTFHIADPTVTPLIDQAQHQTGDAQTATFKKINEYVVDQAWFAPWAQSNNDYAHSSKVSVKAQKYAAYPPLYNYTPAG